jgi:calcineurin-like phosphoesterase family protein
MIYVSADPHLGHANIIEYCNRPFFLDEIRSLRGQIANTTDSKTLRTLESQLKGVRKQAVDLMDATIIGNYNKVLKPDDTLKIVGDFSMSNDFYQILGYVQRINCNHIELVLGNHDYLSEEAYRSIFWKVYVRDFFNFNGQQVVLDHYSGRIWYNSHRGSWLLWGHSHGAVSDYGLSFDVGVDKWDFKPLSMKQVSDIMKTKKQHHIIKDDEEIVEDVVVDKTKGIHKG